MHSVDETTSAIWSAIQRVSPSVTREEIAGLLRVAMDAPTADETYQDMLRRERFTPQELANIAMVDQLIVELDDDQMIARYASSNT